MDRLGAQEGEVLTHTLITRSIEQRRAGRAPELPVSQAAAEYDDVMNQQREVIYRCGCSRSTVGRLKGEALKMLEKAIERRVEKRS